MYRIGHWKASRIHQQPSLLLKNWPILKWKIKGFSYRMAFLLSKITFCTEETTFLQVGLVTKLGCLVFFFLTPVNYVTTTQWKKNKVLKSWWEPGSSAVKIQRVYLGSRSRLSKQVSFSIQNWNKIQGIQFLLIRVLSLYLMHWFRFIGCLFESLLVTTT